MNLGVFCENCYALDWLLFTKGLPLLEDSKEEFYFLLHFHSILEAVAVLVTISNQFLDYELKQGFCDLWDVWV